MNGFYQSEKEIESIVRDFEACETDKTKFKHRDHLTVAVWYLQTGEPKAALERMRSALWRFLDHHGVDREKYNETITIFWIEMVAEKLSELGAEVSLLERCNRVIESLPSADLALEYYSKELLWSDEARGAFVSPDLKSWSRAGNLTTKVRRHQ